MFSKVIISSPWYYFVLSLCAGLIAALWLYFRNPANSELPRLARILLFSFRFSATSLILLLLLNLFLRQLKNETEKPLILLAIDNSGSIAAGLDSSYIRKEFLENLDDLKASVGDKYSVKTILFGTRAETSGKKPDFSEKETDLDELLRTVENNYSNQNIGALVIASDGIYNKGDNPVYTTERSSYPIYTIALGDTSEKKDVILTKVNHNQVAYLGNNFPVEVQVNAKKMSGKEVTVELLDKGESKTARKVKINSDNFSSTVGFTLNAGQPGIVKYTARVTLLDGEMNKTNNQQSFAVEVINNREKLLILAAAPHPDLSAIKESLAGNTTYDISHVILPAQPPPLKAFSLVILHGFSNELQNLVNECIAGSVPFWIINPSVAENIPGMRITGNLSRFNDTESAAERSFGLFNISEDLRKFIQSAPALKTFFGNYAVANGSSVLIHQKIGSVETNNPVLLFNENNGLKYGVFAGEGLWKWKLRDYAEHQNHNLFNELISKCAQYLSVKSDKSFFRIRAPKIIAENESFEIEAEVYNKSYELVNEPDVLLTITNASNQKFNYTFGKNSNGYRLNAGLLAPGEYRYEAQVKVNNEIYKKQGAITVNQILAENLNMVADHRLLYQMSVRSNGKLFYPGETKQLSDEILGNESIRPVTYTHTSTLPIIDLKWIFWLLMALMTIEWFFRKRYLSI